MDLGVSGKVALVTGAASGIGAAIAERLCAEGMRVIVCDIHEAPAQAQAEKLRALGGTALAVQADVTDEGAVAELVSRGISKFGAIHALVNNAGFTRDMRIGKMRVEDWDAVVDVILKGAFLCARAAMPHLTAHGWGRIVNISSRAHLGNPGQSNYSAAKAGLIGFSRALALENGRNYVTVNAVAPGLIDTEAVKALPHYLKIREAAEKSTPIPRIGRPEDVADAVAFLISDRAGFITGEVIHVSGGRY